MTTLKDVEKFLHDNLSSEILELYTSSKEEWKKYLAHAKDKYKHSSDASSLPFKRQDFLDNSVFIDGKWYQGLGGEEFGSILKDFKGNDFGWRRLASPETILGALASAKELSKKKVQPIELIDIENALQFLLDHIKNDISTYRKTQSHFYGVIQVTGRPISDILDKYKRIEHIIAKKMYATIMYKTLISDTKVPPVKKQIQLLNSYRQKRDINSPYYLISPGNVHIFDAVILYIHILIAKFASGSKNLVINIRPSLSDLNLSYIMYVHRLWAQSYDPSNQKGLLSLSNTIYFDPSLLSQYVSLMMKESHGGMYFGRARSFWEHLFDAAMLEYFQKTNENIKTVAKQYDFKPLFFMDEIKDTQFKKFLIEFYKRHRIFHETVDVAVITPDALQKNQTLNLFAHNITKQVLSGGANDCTNINNLFVPRGISDKITNALISNAGQLIHGDLLDKRTDLPQYDESNDKGLGKTLEILFKRWKTHTDFERLLNFLEQWHSFTPGEKYGRVLYLKELFLAYAKAKMALLDGYEQTTQKYRDHDFGDWSDAETLLRYYLNMLEGLEQNFPFREGLWSHFERLHVRDHKKKSTKDYLPYVKYGDTLIVRPLKLLKDHDVAIPSLRSINPQEFFTGLVITSLEVSKILQNETPYLNHIINPLNLPWLNIIYYDDLNEVKKALKIMHTHYESHAGFSKFLYCSCISGADGMGSKQGELLESFLTKNNLTHLVKKGKSVLVEYDALLPHMGQYFAEWILK